MAWPIPVQSEFLARVAWQARARCCCASRPARSGPTTRGPRRRRPPPTRKIARTGRSPSRSRRAATRPGGRSTTIPVLDDLEKQIDISNQKLKSSEAAYRQAVALVGEARAGFLPHALARYIAAAEPAAIEDDDAIFGLGGRELGARYLGQDPPRGRKRPGQRPGQRRRSRRGPALAPGRARHRLFPAAHRRRAEAAARTPRWTPSPARCRSPRTATMPAWRPRPMSPRPQAQLESTRAQAINVGVLRSQLEHAIAVLIGKPPADFAIAPAPGVVAAVPLTPPGLPSRLAGAPAGYRRGRAPDGGGQCPDRRCGRRPTIPTITLGGSVGFAATAASSLFAPESLVWAVGPRSPKPCSMAACAAPRWKRPAPVSIRRWPSIARRC